MKSENFVRVFLAAVVVAFVFCLTACDGGDEPTFKRRVTQIKVAEYYKNSNGMMDNEEDVMSYVYNDNGEVVLCDMGELAGEKLVMEYEWKKERVFAKAKEMGDFEYSCVFMFDGNGKYKGVEDWEYEYRYDEEGRLVKVLEDGYVWCELEWTGGKLMSIKETEDGEVSKVRFEYDEKKCKGFLPFLFTQFLVEECEFSHVMPDKFGLATRYLPNKIILEDEYDNQTMDLTYEMDKKGYVKAVTVIEPEYPENGYMEITFDWK